MFTENLENDPILRINFVLALFVEAAAAHLKRSALDCSLNSARVGAPVAHHQAVRGGNDPAATDDRGAACVLPAGVIGERLRLRIGDLRHPRVAARLRGCRADDTALAIGAPAVSLRLKDLV